jgi:hypothetical protein
MASRLLSRSSQLKLEEIHEAGMEPILSSVGRDCNEEGHACANCPHCINGGSSPNCTPPADGSTNTHNVNGVSESLCGTCRQSATGVTKEHTTTTHHHGNGGRRGGAVTPAALPSAPAEVPTMTPAPIIAALAIGNTGSLVVGDLAAETTQGNSYSGGCLTFHGGLFLGTATGLTPLPNEPDPTQSDDPLFYLENLFHSNSLCLALLAPHIEEDQFHDAVDSLKVCKGVNDCSKEAAGCKAKAGMEASILKASQMTTGFLLDNSPTVASLDGQETVAPHVKPPT